MRVICTTIIRHSKGEEAHGHIYDIDWDTKRIINRIEVPRTRAGGWEMNNPRGGARGGRGVQIMPDCVYVANYDSIIKYDHSWQEMGRITSPLFKNLHEISVAGDGIWAASTGLDLAVKVDFSGKTKSVWSPRTCFSIKQTLGISDRLGSHWPPSLVGRGLLKAYILSVRILSSLESRLGRPDSEDIIGSRKSRLGMPDRGHKQWLLSDTQAKGLAERGIWLAYRKFPVLVPDVFHVNCVQSTGGGVYVTILSWPWREKACVVEIEPDVKVELGTPDLGSCHNGQIIDDQYLIINDTGNEAVKVFERRTNRLVKAIYCKDIGFQGRVWLRGLKLIDKSRVLVGAASWVDTDYPDDSGQIVPPQILEIDIHSGKVLNRLIISEEGGDKLASIHGLDAIQ